jgi:hypothetical protein
MIVERINGKPSAAAMRTRNGSSKPCLVNQSLTKYAKPKDNVFLITVDMSVHHCVS